MTKTTSADICREISAKYSSDEWVTLFEVANGTGANIDRYADAVVLNLWPSKGYQVHGFEVKVSRADFLSEMRDVTKAEAIGKYCDFWWLVVPSGLVTPEEVPESWGLMTLQKNGLRIKKQASKRANPSEFTRPFVASLLRRAIAKSGAHIERRVEDGRAAMGAEFERRLEAKNKRYHETAAKNAEWIGQFEERLGVKFNESHTPEMMVERMKLAEKLEWGPLTRLLTSCGQLVGDIQDFKSVLIERDEA